jgi:MFS family permease
MHRVGGIVADCCGVRRDSIWMLVLAMISLFVYALCYHSNDVVLPYLVRDIGVDEVQYGYLKSWMGALNLVGGVLLGRAGDVYGAKWILFMTQFGSALNYGTLACAQSESVVFLSFIPTIFQQGYQASMMIVANQSSEESRIKAIGRLSLFYGAGALIGPMFGGYLSQAVGDRQTILVGSVLSLSIAVLLLCPQNENLLRKQRAIDTVEQPPASIFSCSELLRLLRYPNVKKLLLLKFLYSFGTGLLGGMLSQFLMTDFGLAEAKTGEILSYIEVIRMIGSGILVGLLVDFLSDAYAAMLCLVVTFGSLALLSFASSPTQLMVLLLPLQASGMVATIISGMQSRLVPDEDTGGVLGLDMAAMSLSWTVLPSIAGWLNKAGGFQLVCRVSAVTSLVACAYGYVVLIQGRHDAVEAENTDATSASKRAPAAEVWQWQEACLPSIPNTQLI